VSEWARGRECVVQCEVSALARAGRLSDASVRVVVERARLEKHVPQVDGRPLEESDLYTVQALSLYLRRLSVANFCTKY